MRRMITTEEEVKDILGIETWRNLSREKIMEFVSILPNIDTQVAVKIIESFPEFIKASTEMICVMKDLCELTMQDASENTKLSIKCYERVIDELSYMLKRDDVTPEDRTHFANKMIEISDKISMKDTEDKQFKQKNFNNLCGLVISAFVLGAGILGVQHIDTDRINGIGKRAKDLLNKK